MADLDFSAPREKKDVDRLMGAHEPVTLINITIFFHDRAIRSAVSVGGLLY